MRKSKLLALVLVLALMFSMFTSCGRSTSGTNDDNSDSGTVKKTTSDDGGDSGNNSDTTDETTDETTTEKSDNSGDGSTDTTSGKTTFEKGQELTAFVTAYTEAKSALMDKLTTKVEDSGDLSLTMSLLGFAMMDLTVAFVPMFDVVDETGFIPFLNIKNAFKKTKGNLITFGADYKIEEDGGADTKGDRIFWDGKLDVKDESLSTIYYTERGGKKISNTVIEITKNKDGSYTSETLSYNESEDGVSKISGTFVSFEGEDMWLQSGEQENGKPDFDYVTVFNKKNVAIKDLSKDFTLSTDITYIKGKITSNIAK
jgi:hypothetical protein